MSLTIILSIIIIILIMAMVLNQKFMKKIGLKQKNMLEIN